MSWSQSLNPNESQGSSGQVPNPKSTCYQVLTVSITWDGYLHARCPPAVSPVQAWPVAFMPASLLELTGDNILFPCPCILAGKLLACILRISSLKALAGLHKCQAQLVLGCMSHNLAADTRSFGCQSQHTQPCDAPCHMWPDGCTWPCCLMVIQRKQSINTKII